MYLTAGFMLAEAIGGWISGSLALLADAGHMFSDGFSLGLALFAFYMGDKAPDKRRTFGYQRFQVLAAFINGLTLLGIAVWILIAAVQRFFQPVEVMAAPMLAIAVLGLLVNVVVFRILHGGDHEISICAGRCCTSWATCWARWRPSWPRWSSWRPDGCRSTRCCRCWRRR